MLMYAKPELEIIFERLGKVPQFELLPRIFGHALLGHDTVDTARRRRLPTFKMVANETGNKNKY